MEDAKDYNKAMNYALSLLTSCDRTEYELVQKMKAKAYEDKIIGDIVSKLKDIGYINDSKYIENWIKCRQNSPGFNKNIVFTKLLKKGINRCLIEEKVGEIIIDEYETAISLAKKKFQSVKGDNKEKRVKIFNYLLRKGYKYDTCKRIIDEMLLSIDD